MLCGIGELNLKYNVTPQHSSPLSMTALDLGDAPEIARGISAVQQIVSLQPHIPVSTFQTNHSTPWGRAGRSPPVPAHPPWSMVRVAAFKLLLTDACAALDLGFGVLAQRAPSSGFSYSPSCSPQRIPSATAEELLAIAWDLFLQTSPVVYFHFLPLLSYFASILTEVHPVYFGPRLPFATDEMSCMGFPCLLQRKQPGTDAAQTLTKTDSLLLWTTREVRQSCTVWD